MLQLSDDELLGFISRLGLECNKLVSEYATESECPNPRDKQY